VGKNLINPMLERHFFRRRRLRLIIQARAIQVQQPGLSGDRQFLVLVRPEAAVACFYLKSIRDFFSNHVFSVVNRPISA
jgi:hypothetical protein